MIKYMSMHQLNYSNCRIAAILCYQQQSQIRPGCGNSKTSQTNQYLYVVCCVCRLLFPAFWDLGCELDAIKTYTRIDSSKYVAGCKYPAHFTNVSSGHKRVGVDCKRYSCLLWWLRASVKCVQVVCAMSKL